MEPQIQIDLVKAIQSINETLAAILKELKNISQRL